MVIYHQISYNNIIEEIYIYKSLGDREYGFVTCELFSEVLEMSYEESPGDHQWKYWDEKIQRVLQWLPL